MKAPTITPSRPRHVMNLWPPFLFAGIRVQHISPDWSEARVALRLRRWNRNYGQADVFAHFRLGDARVAAFRAAADGATKHLEWWFEVDVVTGNGTVVARVRKQLYVRRSEPRTWLTLQRRGSS